MTDEKLVEQLIKDTLEINETFSDEMMENIRNELLKVGNEAVEFYTKKVETN